MNLTPETGKGGGIQTGFKSIVRKKYLNLLSQVG